MPDTLDRYLEQHGDRLTSELSGGTSPMWQVCGKRSLANITLGMGHPGSGAHAPNENILLSNYWKALRATVALFRRYADQA